MSVLHAEPSNCAGEPNTNDPDRNTVSDAQLAMVRVCKNGSPSERREGHDEVRFRHLLHQISTGDEQALTEFYRAFESRIYAFALNRCNDPCESSDILNEVMWEIWRGAGHFEGRSSVLTWVFGIVHHKVIDRLRAKCKYQTEELSPEIPDEPNQSLEDVVNDKQVGERLRHWLGELPDIHREVVHLAFFEDLSQKEISEIIGCPEGTVRARMFYAKRALKRYLENDVNR